MASGSFRHHTTPLRPGPVHLFRSRARQTVTARRPVFVIGGVRRGNGSFGRESRVLGKYAVQDRVRPA